jgi:hypothetical protein
MTSVSVYHSVKQRATGHIFAMKVMRKDKVLAKNHSEYMRQERDILTHIDYPFIVKMHYSCFPGANRMRPPVQPVLPLGGPVVFEKLPPYEDAGIDTVHHRVQDSRGGVHLVDGRLKVVLLGDLTRLEAPSRVPTNPSKQGLPTPQPHQNKIRLPLPTHAYTGRRAATFSSGFSSLIQPVSTAFMYTRCLLSACHRPVPPRAVTPSPNTVRGGVWGIDSQLTSAEVRVIMLSAALAMLVWGWLGVL